MRGVFICYRRADSETITGRLFDWLTDSFGSERVFKDVYSIAAGDDFEQAIFAALDRVDVVLVVMGDRWEPQRLQHSDDFVRREIDLALSQHKRVIPLFVRGAQMPAAGDLPESLRPLTKQNGVPLREDPDFPDDCKKLVQRLRAIAQARPAAAPQLSPLPPPVPTPPVDTRGWDVALGLGLLLSVGARLAASALSHDRALVEAAFASGTACVTWAILRRIGAERWTPGGPPMLCGIAMFVGIVCLAIAY